MLKISVCSDWVEIANRIDEFPPPETKGDTEIGGVTTEAWIFRGDADSSYNLQPGIERAAIGSLEWPALEALVSAEFKRRARTHTESHAIPDDELTWLALMQHYTIPTRLLDFTYSPYVALYFAVRAGLERKRRNCCTAKEAQHIRLWAVDANAVNERFLDVVHKAFTKPNRDKKATPVFMDPDYFVRDRDIITGDERILRGYIERAMTATGKKRGELDRKGCVCAASPPTFNPRLVSQQGIFLINCAEGRSLWESLSRLMKGKTGWMKAFDVPIALILEIERRLFQMNIHEQSLFPDLEGLAGFIRQRTRLHWK